jgi:hypothetical protein
MRRIAGTAARQLELVDEERTPLVGRARATQPRSTLRLLRKDVYAELARRRRRAQIAARHLAED